MQKAFLSMGSNLGDRRKNILDGLDYLKIHAGQLLKISGWYETAPWGKPDQPDFLNIAVSFSTKLDAEAFHKICQEAEWYIHPEKKKERWGPRQLDIDILYFDQEIIRTDHLSIPHPEIQNRNFVLIPLMEIAPYWVDPVSGMTVEELFDACQDTGEVILAED